ncbi:MAG: hypothetical protein ACR2IS_11550 [Nitrososphaeraceae archaeon]
MNSKYALDYDWLNSLTLLLAISVAISIKKLSDEKAKQLLHANVAGPQNCT